MKSRKKYTLSHLIEYALTGVLKEKIGEELVLRV
jgi:hypothetical protein